MHLGDSSIGNPLKPWQMKRHMSWNKNMIMATDIVFVM